MSTISHPPVGSVKEQKWSALLVREMWAALAIFAMWLAVAVSRVWGTDFVSTSSAGTNSTTIPSGIVVAMFATIGWWAVAKHGLAHRPKDSD